MLHLKMSYTQVSLFRREAFVGFLIFVVLQAVIDTARRLVSHAWFFAVATVFFPTIYLAI